MSTNLNEQELIQQLRKGDEPALQQKINEKVLIRRSRIVSLPQLDKFFQLLEPK